MKDQLDKLIHMRPHQWLLLGGFAMSFASMASGIAGVEVKSEMQYIGFLGGIILILVGVQLAVIAKRYDSINKIRELDAELRKEKLEAGLDPADDKTVYKIDDD